jgi:TolB-like protein
VAASYETALAGRLVAGAGYSIPRGRYGSAGLGADWWPVPLFGVRLGAVGLGGKDDIRLTGGISALWKGIGIDYALGTHPLGMNHRFSLSYAFGRPPVAAVADRPEPVPAASPTRETAVLVGTGINIAVAELSAQGMSASDAAVITDVLRNELVKTGRFKVIEKQNMDKVLAEQAFQQTGCTTDECAVRLGKLLNVQRIVVGSFGKLIDKYLVNLRVVNVETGEIIFGDSVGGRTVEEIEAGLKAIAARMAAQIR